MIAHITDNKNEDEDILKLIDKVIETIETDVKIDHKDILKQAIFDSWKNEHE
jgi:hypothetical protein